MFFIDGDKPATSKLRVSKKNQCYYPSDDIQRKWLIQIQQAFDMPFDTRQAMKKYEQQTIRELTKVSCAICNM